MQRESHVRGTWLAAFVAMGLCTSTIGAHAGLIAITDSRADFGGNDFIDLTPLAGPGSPLDTFLNPFGQLLPGIDVVSFSLMSHGGINADFRIEFSTEGGRKDLSAGAPPSTWEEDASVLTVSQLNVTGTDRRIQVTVSFDQLVYGVGSVAQIFSSGGSAFVSVGSDGETLPSPPGVGLPNAITLQVPEFIGFVSDQREIDILTFSVRPASNSVGLIRFNQIDLLTVAPNAEAPFGPGLQAETDPSGNVVPEPSSFAVLVLCALGLLSFRRRRQTWEPSLNEAPIGL